MAANRFGIVVETLARTEQIEMAVASGGAGTIAAGTPTKISSAKAAAMVDGDGTTSQYFTGVAKSTSTDTASAAGIVQLWAPYPNVRYRSPAKSSTLANTQALIDALVHKRVVFDLTGSNWTVDTAAADATANCVIIVGGLPNTSELQFVYADKGAFGNVTT